MHRQMAATEQVRKRTVQAWRRVGLSMAAGALYDAAFAAAILFATEPAGRLLGLALPDDRVYLHLNGIFLVLLAGLYGLAAAWPQRYSGVVAVAAAGRFLGFLFLGGMWLGGRETAFAGLALGDLGFAVLHAALFLAARRPGR